jgi:MFS transporter, ACS family, solute carrier family 17 (sodium-dependent inorganic phosphate cotransporter), other
LALIELAAPGKIGTQLISLLFVSFTDKVTCLQVLNLMVILGFMLNYALRVNLTIAIVAMVVPTVANTSVANVTLANSTASAAALADGGGGNDEYVGTFQWDSYQQNFILGSFFWGYILTELPGGRLAELIGGHRVFGHSMLWASLLTLLTPAAAMLDYTALIILRVLLGFMLGE